MQEILQMEKYNPQRKVGCCPNPDHDDHNPSCSYDPKHYTFHCFAGDTKVITKEGVRKIIDIANQPVEIINGNGEWERASFTNFGRQKLMKLTVTRNGIDKVIYATPEHEWIVRRRKSKVQTKNLKRGDRLAKQWIRPNKAIQPNIDGMIHGFIYGDGHHSGRLSSGEFVYDGIICTKEKRDFCSSIFLESEIRNLSPCHNQKYFGRFHYKSSKDLKKVPNLTEAPEYLMGFLAGYFAADGNCTHQSVSIASANKQDLEQIQTIATLLGIPSHDIRVTNRTQKSNMGCVRADRDYPLFWLVFAKSEIPQSFFGDGSKSIDTKQNYLSRLGYTVKSVEYSARIEDVYCCVTSTHSFVLDGFILTGNCFSCGYTVDLVSAYMMSGYSFIDACRKLFDEAGVSYDFSEIDRKSKKRDYRYPKPKYAENKNRIEGYWAGRGISKNTLDYLDVQEDPEGNTLFQYYDLSDTLVTVKIRNSSAVDKKHRFRHLSDADHMDILFNMNRINPEHPLIITCGEGDAMTAVECGFYNTVSINGGENNFNWIAECWDWLQQFAEIILVPDNDETGKKWLKTVKTRLGEYRIKVADVGVTVTPVGSDPYEINDLNELLCVCGREAVQTIINDAKESEIPSIVDYSDVKKFDMSEVSGVRSGLTDMDDAIEKFYMGSTTVLTGTAGSGKTSLLSTLICQAVDQGYPAFVYSGELSNPSLKSWVDFVHAGRRGLNQYAKTVGHGFYYKVRPDVFQSINEHYKGKIFFYKDSIDQKVSHIMQTAESVVRRYGVRFLVFDNLTSMDLENDDNNKYQKQEEFIRDIVAFATRWDVCCVIVLHPKKMDMYRKMSLFDLQGVSAAVNLTHRVLALYRVKPEEKRGKPQKSKAGWVQEPIPYDVTIEVLKDRFGSGAGKTIGLYYDVPSKRFYDTLENLDFQYKWDKQDHRGEPLPYETPSLVEARDYENEVLGPHQPH